MREHRIVLNLHGLGEPHGDVPFDERPYWLTFQHFRSLLDCITAHQDREKFIFTFDDGNISDMSAAAELSSRGLKGMFFLLTGRFDDPRYCSRENARELVAQGMTVGLHGRDHKDWRSLPDNDLRIETIIARDELSQVIGKAVEDVAIPFGSYDRRVMKWLKRAQFKRVHTSDRGCIVPSHRVWNRNTLRADMTRAEFDMVLSGAWPSHYRIRRTVVTCLKRYVI